MNKLKKFFVDLFSRKKDPVKVPCDYIACSDCVFFYHEKLECGITESDIEDIQKRYTANDVDKFKKR